jgi:environmental stress-induced protein Ves
MSLRIVTPAGRHTTPWRNGAGRTAEIAAHPASTLSGLAWRISVATVETDGPFSPFEGCDRTSLLLTGAGIDILSDDEEAVTLDRPFASVDYPADRGARGRLHGGPVQLLNLIADRAFAITHRLIEGRRPEQPLPAAATTIVHMLRGDARVAAGSRHALSAGDTMVSEDPALAITLAPMTSDALILHATLAPR